MPKERPGSPRVRLFVALDLPPALRDGLAAWTAEAFAHPGLRSVCPQSLHVTLVFLGHRYERDLERIVAATFAADVPAFTLCPEGISGVPRGRPRLFALALADAGGALGAWQAGLSERLAAERLYEPEK